MAVADAFGPGVLRARARARALGTSKPAAAHSCRRDRTTMALSPEPVLKAVYPFDSRKFEAIIVSSRAAHKVDPLAYAEISEFRNGFRHPSG